MIEPTDEMVYAYVEAAQHPEWLAKDDIRAGLAAVLAIAERNQAAQTAAAEEVVRAFRKSKAKGFFRFPRGPVARAIMRLDEATP
jgi:hypothetical protein